MNEQQKQQLDSLREKTLKSMGLTESDVKVVTIEGEPDEAFAEMRRVLADLPEGSTGIPIILGMPEGSTSEPPSSEPSGPDTEDVKLEGILEGSAFSKEPGSASDLVDKMIAQADERLEEIRQEHTAITGGREALAAFKERLMGLDRA